MVWLAIRRIQYRLAAPSLTEQINAAIDAEGDDDSGRAAATAGRAFLASIDDDY